MRKTKFEIRLVMLRMISKKRLKRRQNSLPENCKSQMKKPSPLWRPRVTFLSTPVLLLLGREYLVAKLRKVRSLLGTKCSLAVREKICFVCCILRRLPTSNGTLALGDSGVRYPVTPPRCHETQLCYQFTQMFLFKGVSFSHEAT